MDCDGVILNSNKLKTKCFKETLSEFEKSKINKFLFFHKANGGISRYKKIEYFLTHILKEKKYKTKYKLLIKKYSDLIKAQLQFCKTDKFLVDFLKQYQNKKIFIVSGSDEKELRSVFKKRGLFNYFNKIYGSPKDKNEIIKIIKNQYPGSKFILIGDSRLDYEVSRKNKVDFIFKYPWSEFKEWRKYFKNKQVTFCKDLKILM